jgi:hypothetical protein
LPRIPTITFACGLYAAASMVLICTDVATPTLHDQGSTCGPCFCNHRRLGLRGSGPRRHSHKLGHRPALLRGLHRPRRRGHASRCHSRALRGRMFCRPRRTLRGRLSRHQIRPGQNRRAPPRRRRRKVQPRHSCREPLRWERSPIRPRRGRCSCRPWPPLRSIADPCFGVRVWGRIGRCGPYPGDVDRVGPHTGWAAQERTGTKS